MQKDNCGLRSLAVCFRTNYLRTVAGIRNPAKPALSLALTVLLFACRSATLPTATTQTDAGLDAPGSPDAMGTGVPGVPFVFVASADGNIRVFSIDLTTGSLGNPTAYPTAASPSFLALSPNGKHLFASDEVNSKVLSFAVDRQTGALQKVNELPTGGEGPAHLSVDRTGKWILVAHYFGGTYSVLRAAEDGRLLSVVDANSIGAKAHFITMDRNNLYGVIPCLGPDYVAIRQLDVATGKLAPAAIPTVNLPADSGPRHLAFSPDAKFAYVNGETDSTVSTLSFDEATGAMAVIDTVTTLPDNFAGANTTAEIAVHPNGAYVYVSNRGHNSIARFRRTAATGKLTLLGHTPTGGSTPRSFAIDTTGQIFIAANQRSGSIAVFTIDSATGELTPAGSPITVPSPAYVGVLDIR